MFKDTPLYNISSDKVLNKELLPPFIRNNCTKAKFNKWLERRASYVERDQKKLLTTITQFPDSTSLDINIWIMMITRALSVEDCYWINDSNMSLGWNDVNPINNSLANALVPYLLDNPDDAKDITFETVEYTTGGSVEKAWHRENSEFYMYKSTRYKYEVMVSQILDAMNVEHVKYSESNLYGIPMCKCINIANEYFSRIPASEVRDTFSSQIEFNKYMYENFPTEFITMNVIDYLIGNIDRHGKNWGFLMHNSTGRIIKPHPLFDHNWTFGEVTIRHGANSKVFQGYKLRDVALSMCDKIRLNVQKDKMPEFMNKNQEVYFYNACKECGVEIV